MINKSASLLIRQEPSQIAEAVRSLLEKGEIRREEYAVFRKNGEKLIVDASMNIIKDANGQPINLVVIARDVTEHKKDEDYIRLLSNVAEQAPEGIAAFNLEGKVIFANSAWRKMREISDKASLNEERIENIYENLQVQGLYSTDQIFKCRLTMLKKIIQGSKFWPQLSCWK